MQLSLLAEDASIMKPKERMTDFSADGLCIGSRLAVRVLAACSLALLCILGDKAGAFVFYTCKILRFISKTLRKYLIFMYVRIAYMFVYNSE